MSKTEINPTSPHRSNETWDEYINRRINVTPDAEYLEQHQKVVDFIQSMVLPNGYTDREEYTKLRYEVSDELPRDKGLLVVHGYLYKHSHVSGYRYYTDKDGNKFSVDEWDVEGCTTEASVVATPYFIHCPRIGQRPDLCADSCGYFLTDKLDPLCVLGNQDQIISVAAMAGLLEDLVGKHVRITCRAEFIREACYDGDGCFDRIYLTYVNAEEIDAFGRSAEDKARAKEILSRPSRFVDDELEDLRVAAFGIDAPVVDKNAVITPRKDAFFDDELLRTLPRTTTLQGVCDQFGLDKDAAVKAIYDHLVWNGDDAMRIGNMSGEEIEAEVGLWAREALRPHSDKVHDDSHCEGN